LRDRQRWRFEKIGFFERQSPPYRVQRYRCLSCRRSFSDQTFRATYWMRRPDLLRLVFLRQQSCSGFRQIARELGVSPTTIAGMSSRLGRHCLLLHELLRPKGRIEEELSLDGFEGFEWSQFYPSNYNVAVGKESHFFYGFTATELRRKGRMTDAQRRTRARLEARFGRPDPKGVERDFAQLLAVVVPRAQRLVLHTDEHQAYPRALKRVPHLAIEHRTISSRAARTQHNPLFPVNLLDLLIRHSGSHHKRETIAFSKRLASGCERMATFAVWRNWVKSFSERKRKSEKETPAMRLGLTDRPFTVDDVLKARLFPSQIQLPEPWASYYWRRVPTRPLPRSREHRRRYAV
jgi:transposase-like protein